MKITEYEKRVATRHTGRGERKPRSGLAAKLDAAGLSHNAVHAFRHRHPELSHWDDDRVIARIVANKQLGRQELARRQHNGKRFAALKYED